MDQFHILIKMKKLLNMVDPKNKLRFLFNQKFNKKEIQLQLTKLNFKLVDIKLNKIQNVAILSCKKNKYT